MYFNEDMKPGMRGYLRSTAWTGFLYGLSALIFGVFTIITPAGTLSVFVGAIGFFLLAYGIIHTVSALMGIKRDPHWYIGLGAAVLQLLIGTFIFTQARSVSNAALMFSTVAIGLVGIITGTYNIINAIKYRDLVRNVWPVALRGGLLFLIGAAMLLAPFGFGLAMMRVVGIISSLSGIFQLWTSVRLLRELNE